MGSTLLCEASGCRRDRLSGELQPRTAAPGLRLCQVCRDGLRDDLADLPELYESCEEALVPRRPALTEWVRSGRWRQGIRLNDGVIQARGDMLAVLASWAGVIIDERGMVGPRQREVGVLADYLGRHLDWLAAHPAAGEFAAEIRHTTRTARASLGPGPVVRRELGPCLVDGCEESVHAAMRTGDAPVPHQVSCGAGHDVPPHKWLLLSMHSA